MAEKKQVKIDLKARLGRASSRPGGETPSSPPGVVPPPTGIAPPPGILTPGGIPAPPFAAQQQRPKGPKVDKDDPFAAVSADEAPTAKPAEIRVEIGHEVVQAQARATGKIIIAALAAVVVGGGLGYVVGGQHEGSKSAQAAVQGARELSTDIEKASKDIEGLRGSLETIGRTLFKKKKFPASASKELTGIIVSFDGTKLAGRNINRLKPTTVRAIFDFANDVQQLNERKNRLARMFDGRKDELNALLDSSKAPKLSYGIFVGKGKQGAVGTFARLKTPFEFDKDWPEKVSLLADSQAVDAERYKSGEPFVKPGKTQKDSPTIYVIPIEPDGVAKAFPDRVAKEFEQELSATMTLIRGTAEGETRPGEEKLGLLKLAENLLSELRAVGGKR